MLSSAILRGIDDVKRLGSSIDIASPLRDLIQAYNKKALAGNTLPVITGDSTGLEFKNAMELMDPQDQVNLLHAYSIATGDLNTPTTYSEDPDLASKRKMRELALKTMIFLFVMVVCAVTGVISVMLYQNKDLTASPILKAIVGPLVDVIKAGLQSALGK